MTCPHCGKDTEILPEQRTTGWRSQNHHLNGHIAQIARETGNDFEDVKIGIKCRAIKRGFPPPHQIKVKAWSTPVDVFKSEVNCSKHECAMLIDEAHQVADELGIKLREEA